MNMLYLMMCESNGKNLVKVGESRDLISRRKSYKSHNPLAIMRSSCAGTEIAEDYCHKELAKLGTRIKGTEWFVVSDTVFSYLYTVGMKAFFTDRNIYLDEEFLS